METAKEKAAWIRFVINKTMHPDAVADPLPRRISTRLNINRCISWCPWLFLGVYRLKRIMGSLKNRPAAFSHSRLHFVSFFALNISETRRHQSICCEPNNKTLSLGVILLWLFVLQIANFEYGKSQKRNQPKGTSNILHNIMQPL